MHFKFNSVTLWDTCKRFEIFTLKFGLAIFLIAISLHFIYLNLSEFKQAQDVENWKETSGILKLGTDIKNANPSLPVQKDKSYVEYTIGNQTFYSNRIQFSPFKGVFQTKAPKTSNGKIKVFYNPKEPANAVTSQIVNSKLFLISLIIAISLIIVSSCIILFQSKHKIDSKKANSSEKQVKRTFKKLNKFFLIDSLFFLVELSPIMYGFFFLIGSKGEENTSLFGLAYLVVTLWLFTRIFASFYLIYDSIIKSKKITKAVNLTPEKIFELYKAKLFVFHTVVVSFIWCEWFTTQLF